MVILFFLFGIHALILTISTGRSPQSEFGRRPCRSGHYAEATKEEGRTDHYTTTIVPRSLFCVDDCDWDVVRVFVCIVRRPHVTERADDGELLPCLSLSVTILTMDHEDFYIIRVPGPRVSCAKPGTRLWLDAEPDACVDGDGVVPSAVCTGIRAVHAGCVQDGSTRIA
jgi:hypothetical protein